MDDNDDKDDTKRKSRNLSEKKRRDQFNMLVNELSNMVSTNTRKVDKSTVLKSTILFLKNHNEIAVKSRVHEIEEEWKPPFFSNEEFTHLILEALDGFIMVFSSNGRIYYASESVTSLLGYLPSELVNATIYEITYQDDQSHLYNVLLNTGNNQGNKEGNKVSFTCHMKRGGLDFREEDTYELVQFNGYFRSDADIETLLPNNRLGSNVTNDTKLVFVGTGRLQTPQLIRDMSFIDSTQSEFTSRHSFEWKFLFLDHRAPPIIGYLPFEVLGTSGYDYYHVDDLDKVVTCHESVMQKGEGTSCQYRFLTKGQQWIWLQTRFYIDYNQWNSKPEFIVCTHNVVSYTDVIKQRKNGIAEYDSNKNQSPEVNQTNSRSERSTAPCQVQSSAWSPKASRPSRPTATKGHYRGGESDTNSVSASSQSSRQSVSTTHSSKLKVTPANSTKPFHEPKIHPKLRKPTEVDQSYTNYVEPQRFATEPTAAVPTFIAPAAPTVSNQLSNSTALVNQQTVPMPNVQAQIQDELQRKHEELQQLIVQQQEELRRVSEQLLIARYGILSPLISVNLPYNPNSCQQAPTCGTGPNGSVTNEVPTDSIEEMNVHAIPVTPGPIVPMRTFPVLSMTVSADQTSLPLMSQQQQQPQHHQHHQLQRHEQHQHPHHQSQTTNQDHAAEIMPYQMCPTDDIIYGNVDTATSAQRRQPRN